MALAFAKGLNSQYTKRVLTDKVGFRQGAHIAELS
jgi:hypothetical protein